MLHALTYSIIDHLKTQVLEATDVVWEYDGVVLTGRAKPFITVEQMAEGNEVLTKDRTDYEEVYRFQVGLHARNVSERSRLSDTVKNVLRQNNIPLLDTRGFPPMEIGVFYCDVTSITPIPVDDVSDETNTHRVYFDVSVTVHRVNGSFEIKQ